MNSGVIVKVEYQPKGEIEFITLNIIPHSGNFVESSEETPAGIVYSAKAVFKIAEVNPSTDIILNDRIGKGETFRITDANGRVHTMGDQYGRSRFLTTRSIDGGPGTFNGYECQLTRKGTTAVPTI